MTFAPVTTQTAEPNQSSVRFEDRYNKRLYNKRRFINRLGLGFALSALVFGLVWLIWILMTLFVEGMQGLIEMPVFMADTPPPMGEGGLRNAIVGSVMLAFRAWRLVRQSA